MIGPVDMLRHLRSKESVHIEDELYSHRALTQPQYRAAVAELLHQGKRECEEWPFIFWVQVENPAPRFRDTELYKSIDWQELEI